MITIKYLNKEEEKEEKSIEDIMEVGYNIKYILDCGFKITEVIQN